jgi:molybdopterin-guanine dinucleotide biosynthesis protein A
MVTRCSSAILAGGRSRRMGRDKARIVVGGETLLERTLSALRPICDEVMVVVAQGGTPPNVPPDVRVVVDRVPEAGPLGGLEAALAAASHDVVVVVAVDLPDLSGTVLAAQVAMAEKRPEMDVVTLRRRDAGGDEPLHAVYRRAALPRVTALLATGERRMSALLAGLRVGRVSDAALRRLDPLGRSARNLNTPDEVPRS